MGDGGRRIFLLPHTRIFYSMDALKAEIAVKRKALQDDPLLSSRPNKYMRKGDIEKLRTEQESKKTEEKAAKEQLEKQTKSEVWRAYRHH